LDELGDGIKRATAELNTVFRNFYRDYIIIIVFAIILIIVAVLIIARLIMYILNKSGVNFTGSNTPQSSSTTSSISKLLIGLIIMFFTI